MSESTPRLLTHREGVFALYKPAGWTTDPGDDLDNSLVGWLRSQGKLLKGVRPVHRLDRDTSGVVLAGASHVARSKLSAWFAEGEVTKVYLALVHGTVQSAGVINRPIRGKAAETHVKLLGAYGPVSLVELRPETGRKHQLRLHMNAIRHPIVGDPRYQRAGAEALEGAPGRLWLHAARVALPNGWDARAPLPPELAQHLQALRG